MKALLVYPRFPTTYWGFQHSLELIGRRATLPPLGLLTLAALLPRSWSLRLCDLNVRPLSEAELRWADVVLTGGMLVQASSMRQVLRRARALGKRTVAGGPAPTAVPEQFADADCIFMGEAEGRIDELLAAIERPGRQLVPPGEARPDLARSGVPRFELLERGAYCSMSLQFSRGCPYRCEFCDVVELFGRVPRVKSTSAILAELEALHRTGFRGSLFLVDDNFIGNRRAVGALLPALEAWQEERGRPFELYTEASVDLARDPALVAAMVRAGFTSVFLGIETPVEASLRQAGKLQNCRVDLRAGVDALTGAGLQVMGGFVLGFDADGPEVFEAQRAFLRDAPIPLAMVGLLTALPRTGLHRRLAREGRLRQWAEGDVFGRPNFEPRLDEDFLLRGYGELLGELYSPQGYYRRVRALLERLGPTPARSSPGDGLSGLRALWKLGVRGAQRREFWEAMTLVARQAPHAARVAVTLAIQGEHLLRYTREEVLPALAGARAALMRERLGGACPAGRRPAAAEGAPPVSRLVEVPC